MTPSLGNAKKMPKKWLLVWEMQKKKSKKNANQQQKKCQKNAKNMQTKMQKKKTRVLVKLRFWSFQVGLASRAWAAPPGPFHPGPGFLSRPCTPSWETTPRPGRPKNEFPRASSPALSFFTAGWLSKSFCTCSLYLVLPRGNKRSVMVVIF